MVPPLHIFFHNLQLWVKEPDNSGVLRLIHAFGVARMKSMCMLAAVGWFLKLFSGRNYSFLI